MDQHWWIGLRTSKRSQIYFIHFGLVFMGSSLKRVLYPHHTSHSSFTLLQKWIAIGIFLTTYNACVSVYVCAKQVFNKMVLHPKTCIIYEMQYHIRIVMCTIFIHLLILPLTPVQVQFVMPSVFSLFPPWSTGNYWIAAIYLFLYFQQLDSKGYCDLPFTANANSQRNFYYLLLPFQERIFSLSPIPTYFLISIFLYSRLYIFTILLVHLVQMCNVSL